MSALDVVIAYLNLIAAVVCMIVNIWASQADHPVLRPIRAASAGLLGVISLSYLWLISTGDLEAWSRLMHGLGFLTWPIAVLASVVSVVCYRKSIEVVKEIVE